MATSVASSKDGDAADTSAAARSYWCHACSKTVDATVNAESLELECMSCTGNFVEECTKCPDESDESGTTNHPSSFVVPGSPEAGQQLRAAAAPPPTSLAPAAAAAAAGPGALGSLAGDPFGFGSPLGAAVRGQQPQGPAGAGGLQDFLQQLLGGATGGNGVRGGGGGGVNGSPVQIFLSTGTTSAAGMRNPGDYAFGNIDTILNQLLQMESTQGAPPTSKKFVSSVEMSVVTEDQADKGLECAVCKDAFCVHDKVFPLPCEHVYHPNCILPWIEKHNTCPVCRFQLPTDSAAPAALATATAATGTDDSEPLDAVDASTPLLGPRAFRTSSSVHDSLPPPLRPRPGASAGRMQDAPPSHIPRAAVEGEEARGELEAASSDGSMPELMGVSSSSSDSEELQCID